MCGVFGYVGRANLKIGKNILPHRGPDDWGVIYSQFDKQNITFFQSRLSIIGLGEQGHQPFQKCQGKILVYNGEIYNYLKIRAQLINDHNICFNTDTDTEVLYEAIINWGIDKTLQEINGMFAFAFHDTSSAEMYIARDHLGIKPLYYSQNTDNFIFASEIKSFFELNLRKASLNRDLLGEYFANGWIYEPHTLFQNIFKVQAGHLIKYDISTGVLTDIKYWDIATLSTTNESPNIADIVFSQTMSDVKVGNYFSGGIDSSIITNILKDQNLLCLNMSIDNGESSRVNLMEKAYGLEVKRVKFQQENLDLYTKLIYYLDEPIADPAIIPAYQLAKESKAMDRHVMMSGMGGDEIDAGYSRHTILSKTFLIFLARMTPGFLVQMLFEGKKERDIFRLKEFAQDKSPENYFSLTSYFSRSEISSLIMSERWFYSYRDKIKSICSHVSKSKEFFYLDIKGFLASHNLIYMDKASMAASVEVRVPLLDKDLAKFFFKDIDKKELSGKTRLKKYLKSLMGSNYHETSKAGFSYEVNGWILKDIDWNEIIDFFQANQLIDIDQLKSYLNEMKNNVDKVSMKLWTIYTLFLWIKTFNVIIPNETNHTRPEKR